ncbi:HAD-IIB family hydrolase [Bifidobacterium aquikefiri]|uniref:phosphomannomutase n=1 Tax=Bifidobacterium aquikefiri TaxID=1653207 RepID=A0A261G621_9BIFI|nr:HAD-IIB family hydrolase [Bifidobacterium aquikefiri]OZG66844.1 HAD family hydrolase [Bifidobacterium aquikefiri]
MNGIGMETLTTQVEIASSWKQLDIDDMGARAKVVAFDLDNTLARSKMRMSEHMGSLLSQLTHITTVAIVSGGRFEQFRDQVLQVLPDATDNSRLHLMPTSGTRYYRWHNDAWLRVYAHDLSEADRKRAIASLTLHAHELDLWESRTWGPQIEDRGSQITFSALGQLAPVEAKDAWDPDNAKKNALAAAVRADLPHLQVRSGGSTSVDISAKGIDKAYAVRKLGDILGVAVPEMIFVGDRMDPQGNDYPAACAGTMPVRVANPDETAAFVEELLHSMPHSGTSTL